MYAPFIANNTHLTETRHNKRNKKEQKQNKTKQKTKTKKKEVKVLEKNHNEVRTILLGCDYV